MSIVVGLDVGTTKVCTVIGELSPDGILDIIGEGTVPSQGLKRGVVVNLERTSEAIQQSLFQAERVAGVKAERAYVGVAGTHIKSVTSHGLAAIRRGQQITPADVERANSSTPYRSTTGWTGRRASRTPSGWPGCGSR